MRLTDHGLASHKIQVQGTLIRKIGLISLITPMKVLTVLGTRSEF
jgi:hypothetical protein